MTLEKKQAPHMSELNEQICTFVKYIKKHTCMTQNKMCEYMGVAPAYLSGVMHGQYAGSPRLLATIQHYFPQYTLEDALNNVVKPIKANFAKSVGIMPNISAKPLPVIKEESEDVPMSKLPLLPFDALAGLPTEDMGGVMNYQCEQYYVPEFKARGVDFLVRVVGNSMAPFCQSGDIVAVKRIEDTSFFQWGEPYVLATSQGILLKRLYPDPKNAKKIICHSDNSEQYPEFAISKDEIQSVALVIGQIRLW